MKDEKDLYTENYNTVLGEIKEHLGKWRDIFMSKLLSIVISSFQIDL